MPKIYKRILTPLFFAIVALVILCCSAFADDVSGVPTISINGAEPIPFISSVSFESGDDVKQVTSGIVSFAVTIPQDVVFTVNSSVTGRYNSGIVVNGTLNSYGTIILNEAPIDIYGIMNQYYGSVTRSGYISVRVQEGGFFNLYNGIVEATGSSGFGIYNLTGSVVNVYSGTVSGSTRPIYSFDSANIEGNYEIDTDTITINSSLLDNISDMVSESISWITSFISAVTSNMLLLAFVLVIFTGLGIGLLRRVKSI